MSEASKRANSIWVFDFDGTLSEVVPDRNEASLHPACQQMLTALLGSESEEVAILSSRRLEDLIPRIPFRGILLAASSGLELQLSNGEIVLPNKREFQELEPVRVQIMPLVRSIELNIPFVEIEDKLWSVTVHYRRVSPDNRPSLRYMLAALGSIPGIQVFEGTEALELMMVPRYSKSAGLRKIARITGFDRCVAKIVFAGNDENDARAMRWVLGKGGRSIVVGNRIHVEGALVVSDQVELAAKVMSLRLSQKTPHSAGR